jgi:hypothetical protein
MERIILVIDGIDTLDRLALQLDQSGCVITRAALLPDEPADGSLQFIVGRESGEDTYLLPIIRGLLASDAAEQKADPIRPGALVNTIRSLLDKERRELGAGYSTVIFFQNAGATYR